MAKDGWDLPKGDLMKGKRGVVMGVANHDSIAWGIASQLAAQGAEMALFHLPGMERRVQPLADSIGVKTVVAVDVTDDAQMDAAFETLKTTFGTIDFFVHAIAYAPRDQIKGSFVENATRAGFLQAEVLIMAIEHFAIALAGHDMTRLHPLQHARSVRMISYLAFNVDRLNHGVMRAGKGRLSTSARSAANTAAASRQLVEGS